jgi:hypothetical protein
MREAARGVSGSHGGELTFSDDDGGASESLFLAIAEVTGLMPMVRGIQDRLAAQGADNDDET